MVKQHMLRRKAPRTWPIKKKSINWVTRPHPGAHNMENCMSINTVMKEILGHAKTAREVKKILQNKDVLINKKVIKDIKAQLGFMDILEIPKLKEQYVMIFSTKGKLILKPIKTADTKLCKILSKKTTKGKKTQLGLSDGSTMLIKKDDHKLGDSIVLTLPERKEKTLLKLEKGATVYLTGGKRIGTIGKIEAIKIGTGIQKGMVTIKAGKETFETRTIHAFVVGKDKPVIELE